MKKSGLCVMKVRKGVGTGLCAGQNWGSSSVIKEANFSLPDVDFIESGITPCQVSMPIHVKCATGNGPIQGSSEGTPPCDFGLEK